MKRKSLWIVLIAMMLVLTLAACKQGTEGPDVDSTDPGSVEQPSAEQTTEEQSSNVTSQEQTTEPGETEEQPGYVIAFDSATIGNIASQDMDKMELSFDAEQQALKVVTLASGRPNFVLTYPQIPEVSEYPYVAIRLKTENLESTGVFFMASSGSGYDIVKDGVYTDKTLVYAYNQDW